MLVVGFDNQREVMFHEGAELHHKLRCHGDPLISLPVQELDQIQTGLPDRPIRVWYCGSRTDDEVHSSLLLMD